MTNQLYNYVLIKYWNKVYERICTETLTLIHIGHAHEVFMMTSFLHMGCAFFRIGGVFLSLYLNLASMNC